METALRVMDTVKSFRETRLSALRPPNEFFDAHRISRPADLNTAVSVRRLIHAPSASVTRVHRMCVRRVVSLTGIRCLVCNGTGNYGLIVAVLAVYAMITNPLLLISLGFLIGGFAAINKFAPEPMQVGEHVITQKHLYTALFVIGIPLLWISSPLGTFFWLVGASAVLILGHATIIEPGIESEYATVGESV
ncbi:hypothetical protein EW146_g5292 [Bondarzewia mesenterica]|uniref:PRA1 family protein n=1 Tax=Bondarzewia mesenterica TaxID=1095465 RepID=A0A4S4LSK1_9AGAM|nr:hypothetical protein EW146_g5292 [Bondarzewia mesenterica]